MASHSKHIASDMSVINVKLSFCNVNWYVKEFRCFFIINHYRFSFTGAVLVGIRPVIVCRWFTHLFVFLFSFFNIIYFCSSLVSDTESSVVQYSSSCGEI